MSRDRLAVYDVRSNNSGVYYTLTEATRGAIGSTATVTVKHSTRYDKYSCMTCLIPAGCRHTRFVEGGINDGSITEHAA